MDSEDNLIQPSRSAVAPRVSLRRLGVAVPLSDEVEQLLNAGERVAVRIDGEGKSTALSYLAFLFPLQIADGRLRLEDEAWLLEANQTVVTVRTARDAICDVVMRIAPWGRDDFIEYLLAMHPSQCASVMGRLKHSNANMLFASGSPAVWRMILDRMASDETQSDIEMIVLGELHKRINNPNLAKAIADRLIIPARSKCGGVFGHPGNGEPDDIDSLFSRSHASVREYFSHDDVRHAFALQRFVNRLEKDEAQQIICLLSGRMSWQALSQLASKVSGHAEIESKLTRLFAWNHLYMTANCATLLVACKPGWLPRGESLQLCHGNFKGAVWPEIDLTGADLRESCFTGADLSGARFADAQIQTTDFSDANLQRATFSSMPDRPSSLKNPAAPRKLNYLVGHLKRLRNDRLDAPKTDDNADTLSLSKMISRTSFAGANLTSANLSRCRFRFADFSGAIMEWAVLRETWFDQVSFANADLSAADFSEAFFTAVNLSGAIFDHCKFTKLNAVDGLDFEDVRAEGVDFTCATLCGSKWTESTLKNCKFRGADLSNARMAHIDWENCDLSGADLRGCTFLMGSTRCGLVGSPYPSHGTRTGFYTDDYDDQYFKTPEEIRKASLVNSDLRGANIHNVDFYLVDLRGAKFDATQRQQLITTGAILDM